MLTHRLSDTALFLASLGLCGAATVVQFHVILEMTPSLEMLVIPAVFSAVLATLLTTLWRSKRRAADEKEDRTAPQAQGAPEPAMPQELMALVQAQRNFTAVAGNVMHDINNNVFIAQVNVEELIESAVGENLLLLKESQEGIAHIAARVSAFSRIIWDERDVWSPHSDAAQTLQELRPILQVLAKPTQLSVVLQPQPAPTTMSAVVLAQVILSLMLRAKDAITQRTQKTVTDVTSTLETLRSKAAAPVIQVSLTSTPDTVILTLTDNGIGMSPDEQASARAPLDPSQDIKHPESSLHIVRAQIEQAGGSMHVDSEPDVGTTVTLTLPRLEES